MAALVAERVWAETARALGEERPREYFEVLRACGALRGGLSARSTRCTACRSHPAGTRRSTPVCTRCSRSRPPPSLSPDPSCVSPRWCTISARPRRRPSCGRAHGSRGTRRRRSSSGSARGCACRPSIASSPCMVSRQHARCIAWRSCVPQPCSTLLEQVDAFRRPERLERLILACEADARGRGPELRVAPYPQARGAARRARGRAAVRLSPEAARRRRRRGDCRAAACRPHRRHRKRGPEPIFRIRDRPGDEVVRYEVAPSHFSGVRRRRRRSRRREQPIDRERQQADAPEEADQEVDACDTRQRREHAPTIIGPQSTGASELKSL